LWAHELHAGPVGLLLFRTNAETVTVEDLG
jgi:hypothetical protein